MVDQIDVDALGRLIAVADRQAIRFRFFDEFALRFKELHRLATSKADRYFAVDAFGGEGVNCCAVLSCNGGC